MLLEGFAEPAAYPFLCSLEHKCGTDSGSLLIPLRALWNPEVSGGLKPVQSPLLRVNQSPVPKGMLRKALVFLLARRTAVDIFPPKRTIRENGGISNTKCAYGVNRSSRLVN